MENKDHGWLGAIVLVLLIAFIIGAMRNGDTGSITGNPVSSTPVVRATVPLAPVSTLPAPLVPATAATVLTSFDWSGLRGVAVDHDVTADGRYVLQVANRGDDSVKTFVVPKAIFDSCPIPSEFDGSRPSPCGS